jgi:hypothetical protein
MADKSVNLLDMMLDDSSKTVKKTLGRAQPLEPDEAETVAKPEPKAWPQDPEQLLELTGADLRSWLGALKPGDLLCVVAEGSQSLRQRVIGQLDAASVEWLEGNLKLWDKPTDRLLKDSREAALKVARELLAQGAIAKPTTADHLGKRQDLVDDAARDELTQTLVELIAVAQSQGVKTLAEIIDDVPHPMLQFGLTRLLETSDAATIEETLNKRRADLVAAFAAELELINQAVLTMARGASAESFLERVKAARGS